MQFLRNRGDRGTRSRPYAKFAKGAIEAPKEREGDLPCSNKLNDLIRFIPLNRNGGKGHLGATVSAAPAALMEN